MNAQEAQGALIILWDYLLEKTYSKKPFFVSCALLRITQGINFNMYAQEWISMIMTFVIIILLHDPTESWPGPARSFDTILLRKITQDERLVD